MVTLEKWLVTNLRNKFKFGGEFDFLGLDFKSKQSKIVCKWVAFEVI